MSEKLFKVGDDFYCGECFKALELDPDMEPDRDVEPEPIDIETEEFDEIPICSACGEVFVDALLSESAQRELDEAAREEKSLDRMENLRDMQGATVED